RLRLPDKEPATERERAPSEWLTRPLGESIDLPYLRAHRSQFTAASQRCRQDDQIVVVTQFCFQSLELGNERSDAGCQRLYQAQLIPEGLYLFAPAVQRRRLPCHARPFHRVMTPAIRDGDDRDHVTRFDCIGFPLLRRRTRLLH